MKIQWHNSWSVCVQRGVHLFNSYWRPTSFATTRTKQIRHRQYAIAV